MCVSLSQDKWFWSNEILGDGRNKRLKPRAKMKKGQERDSTGERGQKGGSQKRRWHIGKLEDEEWTFGNR